MSAGASTPSSGASPGRSWPDEEMTSARPLPSSPWARITTCPRSCSRTSVRFSELDGARIGVWGAGREITSLAGQLARRLPSARIAIAAFDAPPPRELAGQLMSPCLEVALGAERLEALAGCDVVVRSPGVSIHRPEMIALRERGVPVTTATSLWLAEHGP